MSPYISRVVRGECIWEYAPKAQEGLNELLRSDSFAHGELVGLIEDSEQRGGLGKAYGRKEELDYRAPLPFAPDKAHAPPWLGELKVVGKRGVEHRLYFSEPDGTDENIVVAVGYGYKERGSDLFGIKQRDHITKVMGYTKYVFRTLGYTCRPFE
ncbi:hypothetical protein [Mycobacteroides chelonae]|uniref:Uncharacterized protein n=1 Tax=Mycobacteroides chelonae TaxID=1774 RepID=A0AB73U4N6_MYCCH|nr:hypothetical protein [Mycobacteroides chelonae]MEC4842627.1 hypothetical protein [Mycobacteroides chelonae]MEC4847468.1 hypothetical protein [Mycobacteroides chelonae]OLT80547.1 hypothetical protein BKG57_11125 [Mycobacteroides chelonae]QDF71901.1 hypothetical protein FJK96_18235 [Mycobacteroides chelonae]